VEENAKMEKYHTQWAAQFYVAAELTRRGCLVSFTMGNAKRTDLHVENSKGEGFSVQVKGAKTRNGWYVSEPKSPHGGLYYVLVYVPDYVPDEDSGSRPSPRFFVLTEAETKSVVERDVPRYMEKHGVSREEAEKKVQTGVAWKDANLHAERWDKLPQ
jgi:hypothetical protein